MPYPKIIPNIVEQVVQRFPPLGLDSIKRTLNRSQRGTEQRQRFAIWLGLCSFSRASVHRRSGSADSFSSVLLREGFCIRNDGYKPLLEQLYDFQDRGGYSRTQSFTRPYRIRSEFAAALKAALEADTTGAFIDVETGSPVALQFPNAKNGLEGTGLDKKLVVPSVFPIDPERLTQLIARARSLSPTMPLDGTKPNGLTVADCLAYLLALRPWVSALNGIPNIYSIQSHGRLGPALGFPSVVSMQKVIRNRLLAGSALSDFDIVSCYPSIFVALGKRLKFETSLVEQYISDRRNIFAEWNKTVASRPDGDWKQAVLSLFTGGTFDPKSRDSYSTRLVLGNDNLVAGTQTLAKLALDPFAIRIAAEIADGMQRVIRYLASQKWKNAVGAVLAPAKQTDLKAAASHALTGYEQLAMRIACQSVKGLKGICFDGFIAPKLQDLATIEDRVRERSKELCGVELKLTFAQKSFDAGQPLSQQPKTSKDFAFAHS